MASRVFDKDVDVLITGLGVHREIDFSFPPDPKRRGCSLGQTSFGVRSVL